ncbi:MAG: hypothetical protein LBD01_02325, partial [Puniceicoccales bacterium]|nr:hypothetical protein [Puniceicoccales bacterium]
MNVDFKYDLRSINLLRRSTTQPKIQMNTTRYTHQTASKTSRNTRRKHPSVKTSARGQGLGLTAFLAAAAFFVSTGAPKAWARNISANTNLRTEVNSPGSDRTLNLQGNVNWSGTVEFNNQSNITNRNNVVINGNNNVITQSGAGRWIYLGDNTSFNANLAMKNVTVRGNGQNVNYGVFHLHAGTLNLNLEGATFENFTANNTNWYNMGMIFHTDDSGARLNINTGTTGAIFRNNVGKNSGTGALDGTTGVLGVVHGQATITGAISFINNSGSRYGGAVAVNHEGAGALTSDAWGERAKLTFNPGTNAGKAIFEGNHAPVFGGAIDIWGRNSETVFNSESLFANNYTYALTAEDSRAKRAGAINIGNELGRSELTFNAPVTFENNRVIGYNSNETRGDALGGAITAYSTQNTNNYDYRVKFNSGAIFRGNYAHAPNPNRTAQGGAIYYDAGGASLDIGPNSSFEDNYAKNEGGAIYLSAGTINLTADSAVSGAQGGNIIFRGNYQNVSFSQNGNAWTWRATNIGSGAVRNSIYLATGGILNINAKNAGEVHFYDPIIVGSGSGAVINKNGTGDLVFHNYNNSLTVYTFVNAGRLILDNDKSVNQMMIFGNDSAGMLTIGPSSGNTFAAVVGRDATTFSVGTVKVQNGGRILLEGGGTLTVKTGTFTVGANAGIGGNGIIKVVKPNNTAFQITTGGNNNVFYISTPLVSDVFRLESTTSISTTGGIGGSGILHKEGLGTFYANGYDLSTSTTGANKNTYAGGTIVGGGEFVVTSRGTGDSDANKSSFSLGTGNLEVRSGSRIKFDFSKISNGSGVAGNYTINNTLSSNSNAGEIYVNLANAGSPYGAASNSNLTITNSVNYQGSLNLNNLKYTLATGVASVANAKLIVGPGSMVAVPTGNHPMNELSLAGGVLSFIDGGLQTPISGNPQMASFIQVARNVKFGTSGVDPQSYIHMEMDENALTQIVEGSGFSGGQPVYAPLMLQDDYGTMRQFVQASQVTGDIGNVVFQVKNGAGAYKEYIYTPSTQDGKVNHDQAAIYSGTHQENWATSGGVTAKRTLQTGNANLNTGPQNDGLYIGAKLVELELLANKQTVLDNTQSYTALNGRGNEFSVKITGSGHLGIVGKPGTPVILS